MNTWNSMKTILLIASTTAPALAVGPLTTISCDELSQQPASVISVDVRYPVDYQRGHIKGAVSLPYKIKPQSGRGGAANLEFDLDTGDIISPETGDIEGNLLND